MDHPKQRQAQARERERKALEYMAAGITNYEQLAGLLDVKDRSVARRICIRALARVPRAEVANLRIIQGEAINKQIAALFPKALRADVAASRQITRLHERQAKLFGLDHSSGLAERQLLQDQQRLLFDMMLGGAENLRRTIVETVPDPVLRDAVLGAIGGWLSAMESKAREVEAGQVVEVVDDDEDVDEVAAAAPVRPAAPTKRAAKKTTTARKATAAPRKPRPPQTPPEAPNVTQTAPQPATTPLEPDGVT